MREYRSLRPPCSIVAKKSKFTVVKDEIHRLLPALIPAIAEERSMNLIDRCVAVRLGTGLDLSSCDTDCSGRIAKSVKLMSVTR